MTIQYTKIQRASKLQIFIVNYSCTYINYRVSYASLYLIPKTIYCHNHVWS